MTARRVLPRWFAALLIADLLVTALVAAMLVASPRPRAVAPVWAAAAILVGGGAAAGAGRLWRHDAEAAAMTLALLPMIMGIPYVFATLGLPF